MIGAHRRAMNPRGGSAVPFHAARGQAEADLRAAGGVVSPAVHGAHDDAHLCAALDHRRVAVGPAMRPLGAVTPLGTAMPFVREPIARDL